MTLSGVSSEAYKDAIVALLTHRKPVQIPLQGKSRSPRCLADRIRVALRYYRQHPDELPGIDEAYKAVQVRPEKAGVVLMLRGWIAGKPVNTRRYHFNMLDTTVNR